MLKRTVSDSGRFSYDYFCSDYVCRLCWNSEGTLDLSSKSPKCGQNNTIAEMILECVGIDVTRTLNPKKICKECLNQVELYTEFKKFCQQSDKKLLEIIENGLVEKGIDKNNCKNNDESNQNFLDVQNETEKSNENNNTDITNLDLEGDSFDNLLDIPLSEYCNQEEKKTLKRIKDTNSTYCNSCQLDLESKEKYQDHKLKCHGIDKNGHYQCYGCNKTYKSMKKRLRHEMELCKELKLGYKCNICNKFLAKRRQIELHLNDHRLNKIEEVVNGFNCKFCLKTFESQDILLTHITIHQKEKKENWICDTCGRIFKRPDYLRKHQMMHEGNKQHQCQLCDFRSVQRSTLIVHLRKHTGERPYSCELCPRRCVTSSNLVAHMKRHLGVKAFQCQLCDKKFGYKVSLQEHVAATHEQAESHRCELCNAAYSRFRGLRRHLLAKHGLKVSKGRKELQNIDKQKIAVE